MTTDVAELGRHARTYHGFTLGVKWFCIHMATLLTLLVLWFCTPVGLPGAVAMAVIVFAILAYAMRRFLAHSTENDSGTLVPGISSEQLERGPIDPSMTPTMS
jgi:ABC-type polysaccharide/polyol phosphate export permease